MKGQSLSEKEMGKRGCQQASGRGEPRPTMDEEGRGWPEALSGLHSSGLQAQEGRGRQLGMLQVGPPPGRGLK